MAEQSGGARVSKAHVDHWKHRIFKGAYTRDGERIELPDYSVRIQHSGRRVEFQLGPNAARSAERAREIYTFVQANGWPAALAKYKPEPERKQKSATVGEVIAAAEKVAAVKARSFAQYCSALRQIGAELAELDGGKARFAYKKKEAFKAWRAQVDAVPLSVFTPEALAEWRAKRVAAQKDPTKRRSAEISADSTIRTARGLFGKDLAALIRRKIELPDPLPFAGMSLTKSTKRFQAEVSPEWLFNAACSELKAQEPEVFKALVLCLLAGLRRAEADCLTWAQVDLEAATIDVRKTEHFSPKSDESERRIDLSPEAVNLIRAFKALPEPDGVFVLKGGKARPFCRFEYYRADKHPQRTWTKLAAWLAGKGITAKKPIHSLRKQAGSLIHARYGIEAARGFLGHSDISTTSASYVDKKPRVTVTLTEPETAAAGQGKEAGHA